MSRSAEPEMINGEGTGENLSAAVDSHCDPPDNDSLLSPKSDTGDVLTYYSSCESEYERYCSANSAMGTPTVCSSQVSTAFRDFPDSFGLGDEQHNGWNCGIYRKLSEFGDPSPLHENEYCKRKSEAVKELVGVRGGGCGAYLYGNAGLFLKREDSLMEYLDIDGGWRVKTEGFPLTKSDEEGSQIHGFEEDMDMGVIGKEVETYNGKLEASGLQAGLELDAAESGGCLDGCDTSSRSGHSEDDHSMYGGETDTEERINSYCRSSLPQLSQKRGESKNQLCMNSAVAFGSDDWDDFMQETEANSLVPLAQDDFRAEKKNFETETGSLLSAYKIPLMYSGAHSAMQQEEAKHTLVIDNPEHTSVVLSQCTNTNTRPLEPSDLLKNCKGEQGEHPKVLPTQNNQSYDVGEPAEFFKESAAQNLLHSSVLPEVLFKDCLKNREGILSHNQQYNISEEGTQTHSSRMDSKSTTLHVEPLSGSASGEHSEDTKTVNLELKGFYDEIVHDMEEILLDSSESSGFALGNRIYQSYIPLLSRDGGSSASTSGTDDVYPVIQHPWRISGIEVIGARQISGNVSLSERMLGVKEYTVYKIRVWNGEEKWDVERRFRDFLNLYRCLKKTFTDQGLILPSPWSSIQLEPLKIFRSASPDVIAERSVLIQVCLQSVLHTEFPSAPLNALFCFLSPSQDNPNLLTSNTNIPKSPHSTFGKTLSLIVQNRPFKSVKQLLDEQHYSCAGCHMNFGVGKSRIQEFVQTLGWGRPRLCEYSGQLYCSSCHTNETAVLPARVLHYWDFNYYSVSQMAKSYLESIHDQPMLCVSAVNPVLFSKVPSLQHVTNMRKRIGVILPFVRCNFRASIFKAVGSRRYLLEGSDFFALRDLIDLSKGVFAALPVMVETISRKITEHIAEQCLICCDVGIPCNARQHCDDLSSLIFPFQEGEIERCKSCKTVFHRNCFKKISACPCGVQLKSEPETNSGAVYDNGSKRFLSALFPKVKPSKSSSHSSREQDTVILMGSLPSNTL